MPRIGLTRERREAGEKRSRVRPKKRSFLRFAGTGYSPGGARNTARQKRMTSHVEQKALAGKPLIYSPQEKLGVIVVDSFPDLGTLAALRFLEWVQSNPEGVVALPTGKTPEYFIKEVKRLLGGWKRKAVQNELAARGIDPSRKCALKGLHFAQIDEFYPVNPLHHNSFFYYVNHYYIEGFGLDPAQAMLIDCSRIGLAPGRTLDDVWPDDEVDLTLRYRMAGSKLEQLQRDVIQQIDEWCTEYEERIRSLGGIGFFLGGIGPDGHIGFNVRGSDPYSATRLTAVNYETQAAKTWAASRSRANGS
jgi:glucosamine-6-phosphate deaminase